MDSLRHELTRFIQQPAAQQDPPALYRRLLAEAPVLDLGRVHVVSGYEEIVTVLMHPGTAVDPTAVGLPRASATALSRVVDRMLPMRDGADHTRLKRLATTAFSARRWSRCGSASRAPSSGCSNPARRGLVRRRRRPVRAAAGRRLLRDPRHPRHRAGACHRLGPPGRPLAARRLRRHRGRRPHRRTRRGVRGVPQLRGGALRGPRGPARRRPDQPARRCPR
ncbi:hypothetical protein ACFQ1I_34390 [Kitasatospora arboriphila]